MQSGTVIKGIICAVVLFGCWMGFEYVFDVIIMKGTYSPAYGLAIIFSVIGASGFIRTLDTKNKGE